MPKEYSNENSGVLFVNNKKKEQADEKDTSKWPDYTGQLDVGGVEYWVSGWKKQSKKDGSTFLSLAITLKEDKPAHKPVHHQEKSSSEDEPF